MRRSAFTMLELVFVIVVMGILAKFGVELFKQTYEGYSRSLYINELQTKSANAVQTIANRLTYRIKDSINTGSVGANTITWMGLDIDGWQSNAWSGIVDLNPSTATVLSSPGTQPDPVVRQIFFIGSNVGTGLMQYYPVLPGTDTLTGNFANQDVYEYFQMTDGQHTLLRNGSRITLDGNLLTDDVGTAADDFVVEKLGDGIHIHLCLEKTGNPLVQGKTCKDKFVF